MKRITLIGAEDVSRAGWQIERAAESMSTGFYEFQRTLTNFLIVFTEQVDRLEEIMKSQVGKE